MHQDMAETTSETLQEWKDLEAASDEDLEVSSYDLMTDPQFPPSKDPYTPPDSETPCPSSTLTTGPGSSPFTQKKDFTAAVSSKRSRASSSTESRGNTPIGSQRDLSDVDSDQMDFTFAATVAKRSRDTCLSENRANHSQMSMTSDEDFDVLSDDQMNYPHFIPAEENSDSTDSETPCTPSTPSPKSKPGPVKQKKSMSTLTIKTCSKTKDGKRLYDKKHFCIYCMKPNSKISRHLERKHGDEEDVARACSFPKGSKKRSALLEELRNKGDYQHNILVLEEGKGEIVTWRQPPGSASIEDYLPCSHCLAFFVKSMLWRHELSCRPKKEGEKGSKVIETSVPRKRVQSLASHLIPICKSTLQESLKTVDKSQQESATFLHSDFSFDATVATKKSRLSSSTKTRATRPRSQRVPNYTFSDQMSLTSDEDFDVLSDDQMNYPHFIPAEENSDSTDSETPCTPSTPSPKSKPGPVKQKKSMSTLTIKTCSKTKDGKRLYDKKHFCIYCMKPNSKISRHLERKHGDEEDVARACSFPKGSKKRSALLEELRNKGDYQHNILVLEEGKGEIVISRKSPGSASIEDYLPCSHCLGFFVKSELRRHESLCQPKNEEKRSRNNEETEPRKRVQSLVSHLISVSKSVSEGSQKIVKKPQQESAACLHSDFTFDATVATKKSRLSSSTKTRATRPRSQRVPNYTFSDQMSLTSDEDFDVLSDDQMNYPHFIPAEENSDSTDSETPCTPSTLSPKSKIDPIEQEKSMSTLTIKTCSKTKDGKRLYDKKHFCIYCMKPNSKISRHLERKHGDEEDVARACSFPKGSKKRSALLEELRKKGDYQHNILVLEEGKGEIVTWRQPPGSASIEDYLPCSHCLGFFVKSKLWRHESSCRPKKEGEKGSRKRVQSIASHLIPISKSASEGCQKIIHKMQQDSVAFHIRNDLLICQLGDCLYAERGHELSQHGYICKRLREVGRLMLVLKELDNSVKHLQDVCKPSRFELVLEAAKKVSRFNPDVIDYTKTSLVIRIGHSLTKAAECLASRSVINGDVETHAEANKFVKLMTSSWRGYVTSNAHRSIKQKNCNKEDAVPLTEVVKVLQSC
ncbi:uncharacterized protein LOC106023908 isoform X2 [Esox lucius]|uniref:uncharacterized protein LOC106023908 isoform X2 n=1 Tax=Esox lucius TaxID=8010 RepID=UPI0014771698|nr:uncharacterized protein LOC106023908 isoform X2 [Esox lucius]